MWLREQNYLNETLEHHLVVMNELIQRDKNRPSVVMWSLANEPDSSSKNSQPYYFEIVAITFACDHDFSSDLVTQYMDVVMINRYYGWYSDSGHPEVVSYQLSHDLDNWYQVRKKPIMISEYGAGTIDGLHEDPPVRTTRRNC